MKTNIIIFGGGVTGSALAYFLSKKNIFNIKIIEKENYLGGLSRSQWIKSHNCWNDIGPHIFHSPDPEITDVWSNLFGDLFQLGDYYCGVVKGKNFDHFYPYPISIEGIKKSTNIDIKNLKASNISTYEQAKANNFREMMIAKLGSEIEEMFFRDYPEKLWGMPTNIIRSEWAPKRISIRDNIETFFKGQFVATCKKGAGQAYKRIFDELSNSDCNFSLSSIIKGLKIKNNKISEINVNNNFIKTDNSLIINTIPIPIIARFLGKELNLKYRGVRISNWIISERNFLPNQYGWIYFDSHEIPFTRLTDYTKMSPESIDNKFGILTVECPFSLKEDDQDIKTKEEHLDLVKKNLEEIPWLRGKVLSCSSFFEEPYVYPIRELGYEEEINTFNSLVAGLSNFWSLGAAGGFEYTDAQILFRKAKDFADDLENDIKNGSERILSNKIDFQKDKEIFFSSISNNLLTKSSCKIISEIGLNHNGSIDLARKLIIESKNSGADLVKFQLYNPEKRASSKIRDAFYSEVSDGEGENLQDIFNNCHFNFEQLSELKTFSDKVGIEMFFSAFDKDSVYKASILNSSKLKISSMDLTNIEVWEEAIKHFNTIFASTGMSSIDEVDRSYRYATQNGKKIDITLLHCVSSYPMPIGGANLGRMHLLNKICKNVGYSDHSISIEIPFAAALMGAKVIEKHFTLDNSLTGPDHIHSASPKQFKKLCELVKNLPNILDEGTKGISKIQKTEMMKQKKGYFFATDLEAGEILIRDHMKLGAPCLGSDTFECYELIGLKLKNKVFQNQPINKNQFHL